MKRLKGFCKKYLEGMTKIKMEFLIKKVKLLIFLLNLTEFIALMKNYKDENLTNKEIENIFEGILQNDAKGIDFKTFVKYST